MSKNSPAVMVVEDEDLLLQAITKKLKTSEIDTVSCTSGEQAIDYLKELSESSELPDAIWLDYHLEKMNGLEVLTQIKSEELTKDIPVIIISNSASDAKVKNMLALGANKYLLKAEHRLDEIIEIIKEIVQESNVHV